MVLLFSQGYVTLVIQNFHLNYHTNVDSSVHYSCFRSSLYDFGENTQLKIHTNLLRNFKRGKKKRIGCSR